MASAVAAGSAQTAGKPRLHRKDCFFGLHFDLHPNKGDKVLGRDVTEEMIERLLDRRVHLELTHRWDADAGKLPQRRVAQSALDADVAVLDLDNCFDGWSGPARIRDEKLSLRLTSSLTHAVVYTPPQRDFFCVEPVSHVNNAIRSSDPIGQGLIALGSGETAQAWMQLDVART